MKTKIRQRIRTGIILFSFFIFPAVYYYMSPYLIVDAAAKGIINGSFIIFSLLSLSSLVLGRGFCGWVCPAGGCQEALFPARKRKLHQMDYLDTVDQHNCDNGDKKRRVQRNRLLLPDYVRTQHRECVCFDHISYRAAPDCRSGAYCRQTFILPSSLLDGPVHDTRKEDCQPSKTAFSAT